MRKLLVNLAVLCFPAAVAWATVPAAAAESPQQDPYQVRIQYGPYVQAVTENSFTVVWKTTCDAVGWLEVAPDDNTAFLNYPRRQYYESHLGMRSIGRWHTVTVTGLEKAASYRYRVLQKGVVENDGNHRVVFGIPYGTNVHRREPYKVTTLNPDKDSVKVWVFQDIHSNDSLFRRSIANIRRANPDFVVINGDMSLDMVDEELLMNGYLQSAVKGFATDIPIYHTRGNHDMRGKLARNFLGYFPTTTGRTYYGFRQGPVYFLMLDSAEDKDDNHIEYFGLADSRNYREQEAEWLRKTIASEEFRSSPVKVAFMHVPPAMIRSHADLHSTELFVPILREAGIDLLICGHYHGHLYTDGKEEGFGFPVLVNSIFRGIHLEADAHHIGIKVVDGSGKVLHTYEYLK